MTISGNGTIGESLAQASNLLLAENGFTSPRLDCEVLLGHVLHCSRIDLVLNREKRLSNEEQNTFAAMVKRRLNHEPVSYITQSKEFMSLDFFVEQGVLIPRPETEMLVEFIIKTYETADNVSILDLCTGSGAIAVSLAYYLKNARLTAVDKFDVCINAALKNAARYALSERISVIQADILNGFHADQKHHCIVSNPPYIKNADLSSLPIDVKNFEPEYALNGGGDGLEFYRNITAFAAENLFSNGKLVFEIGFDQGGAVKKIIEENSAFHSITITKDFAGLDRMVTAVKGNEAYGKKLCPSGIKTAKHY